MSTTNRGQMTRMSKKVTLPEYIRRVGIEQAAVLWDCKKRTVESWMRKERYPRPEQARVIVSKSPVTMEGIYGQ